jgi:hypothetical protein
MESKLDVVVPVVDVEGFSSLLDCLENQSVIPKTLIIIDNSKGIVPPINPIFEKVVTIWPKPSWGVNKSWNAGLACVSSSYVAVLNDTVFLDKYWIEKVQYVFNHVSNAGVVCPYLSKSDINISHNENPIWSKISKREGWAWSIKKSLLNKIPPIPDELEIFCGDDWYWYHVHKLGYDWFKIMNSFVVHSPGVSANPEYKATLKHEKRLFAQIIEGLK